MRAAAGVALKESARAVLANSSGGPAGSGRSRGTRPVYHSSFCFCQHASAAATRLPAQGLRARLPAAALESAVLPGPGVPEGCPPLAERAAAASTSASAGGASAAGSSRAAAASTAASSPRWAGVERVFAGGAPAGHGRVVTQEKKFRSFLSSAGVLRAAARGHSRAGSVLRRRLPPIHATRSGSRTQVVAAQHSLGPPPAAWRGSGSGCEAA